MTRKQVFILAVVATGAITFLCLSLGTTAIFRARAEAREAQTRVLAGDAAKVAVLRHDAITGIGLGFDNSTTLGRAIDQYRVDGGTDPVILNTLAEVTDTKKRQDDRWQKMADSISLREGRPKDDDMKKVARSLQDGKTYQEAIQALQESKLANKP